ncbi:T9SS type A sorting domain-containing protein [Hymenobacter sp. BRD67]|uniref:T9SS type A sorting domain-containing protein n=1 Tax=Hymenobacter sp. BRD67 TaxID=2675877 RepID=UPI0015651C92|nr:T9SS type A sorting domain-containing protein [Hymenobacter sp. BRD67]QKG54302.1 T9SS type A sorting domain-containing protein [Hymenobacter sp. BRD67]
MIISNSTTWTQGFNFPGGSANSFTNAAGASTTFAGYLGLAGKVMLVNNGTMSLGSGMSAIAAGSTLQNGAGSTFDLTGDFVNQGTVMQQGALTISNNFTNSGTITGPPALPRSTIRAGNYTVNSGNFGADGSYLNFCDAGAPSTGFDSRGGTIGSNVTFCGAAPLPVTLTSFTAQLRQGQVQLRWTTASELGNEKFVLERSATGAGFAAIGEVAGQGTVPTASSYAFLDAQPLPGRSYYRLRQLDLDGNSTLSPVVSVSREQAPVQLYPNPTDGLLTLDLRSLPAAACPVRLLSLAGQVQLAQTLLGGQLQPLSLRAVPAGSYLLEINAAAPGCSVQRVVKY